MLSVDGWRVLFVSTAPSVGDAGLSVFPPQRAGCRGLGGIVVLFGVTEFERSGADCYCCARSDRQLQEASDEGHTHRFCAQRGKPVGGRDDCCHGDRGLKPS